MARISAIRPSRLNTAVGALTPNSPSAIRKRCELFANAPPPAVPKARRLITEAALLSSLQERYAHLCVVSDGAGQFNVLEHGACWVHAERLVYQLIPANDQERERIAKTRGQIWDLYAQLKDYRLEPCAEKAMQLSQRFDAIFRQETSMKMLNELLLRLYRKKDELLLVLKHPIIPLHTNASENDIRSFVKKRKISGGTRSDLGRSCRDTFISLKITCRKLGLSFWAYLVDRLSHSHAIPPLSDIIAQRIAKSGVTP